MLALGTYRDVELEVGRPFAASLERLLRQQHARRIALRRLPQDEVADFLAADRQRSTRLKIARGATLDEEAPGVYQEARECQAILVNSPAVPPSELEKF